MASMVDQPGVKPALIPATQRLQTGQIHMSRYLTRYW